MPLVSISPTNDITKINNKKNTVTIPNDTDPSSFDILIKNKLYLEDLYKYLHVYDLYSWRLCDEYIEVVLEIASAIDDNFISRMISYLISADRTDYVPAPIMYPDSTKLPTDSDAMLTPVNGVVYAYGSRYDSSHTMIYKNMDNPNIIKIKAEHNVPALLSRIISKLSGDIPPPSSLNKYVGENNLIDMTLPEFVELYTAYFGAEVSYDIEGNPYIMTIMSMHAFIFTLLNLAKLNTFNLSIPSDRSQYDKRVSKSLIWELPDSSFDTIYIANKKISPPTGVSDISDIIENIKYKNNFILEKSEDGILWYPVLGVPYTSEKSIYSEAVNISLSDMKILPADTAVTNVSARYITIDTPVDYMIPTNTDKYLYLSSILVYDETGAKIPFTISNKHFTNANKNGVLLSDTELAEILASDDITSCAKLETADTVSLTLDLGSTKSISKILVNAGDTSRVDTTKYKYNVKYGLSLDNMSIAYTYENITEPPGHITMDTPTTPVYVRDPWILCTPTNNGGYDSGDGPLPPPINM